MDTYYAHDTFMILIDEEQDTVAHVASLLFPRYIKQYTMYRHIAFRVMGGIHLPPYNLTS